MRWSSEADERAKTARKPMTRAALEQAIAEAVRASCSECQDFVGVIVERIAAASAAGGDWAVKGVRYGKAKREICDSTLSRLVAEKQLEYELSE
jgi:hypothetical protein